MTRALRPPIWMQEAPCHDKQAIFFDEGTPASVKQAKAICASCDRIAECLQYAIQNKEIGVWGGMTTNQRRKSVRKKRTPKEHKEPALCSNVISHGSQEA